MDGNRDLESGLEGIMKAKVYETTATGRKVSLVMVTMTGICINEEMEKGFAFKCWNRSHILPNDFSILVGFVLYYRINLYLASSASITVIPSNEIFS